jgi:cytochrome P450
LVRNIKWNDLAGEQDVYKHFAKFHDAPDIFYTPYGGGHWVATRHEDMEYIVNHPEDFSNQHETLPPNPFVLPLLEYDGAIHNDFRQLLIPFFTPKHIGNLEVVARDLTVSLIEGFYAKGECEFCADFSQKMPIIILMSLLDLEPNDRPFLFKLSEDIVRSGDGQIKAQAFQQLGVYIHEKVIPARRAKPGKDIFSAIMAGKVGGGRPVTDQEIVGLGSLLIAAGLDTVTAVLGFIAKFLAENPGHRQQLLDEPSMLNDALEEMLRRFHISNVARMVARDIEYKGIQFKAGDDILIPLSAAGIDPKRYKDPFTVDFKRNDKKTLVFGRGPHQCIGSMLARTELRVFLREWLKRIPHFEIKAGERPVPVLGSTNGWLYLPLTWRIA